MRILVQPFEQKDGTPTWDNSLNADSYVFGEYAIALGRHFDNVEGDNWEEVLEELEAALIAYAEEITGQSVRLAPEYI